MQKKIQLLEKEVQAAGNTVKLSDDLDLNYKKLTGIAFLDIIGLKNILVSSSVSSEELLPRNFEVSFLQTNNFVPPDERFFTLYDFTAEGNKIELEFKDGGDAATYPYVLRVYLRLEENVFDN